MPNYQFPDDLSQMTPLEPHLYPGISQFPWYLSFAYIIGIFQFELCLLGDYVQYLVLLLRLLGDCVQFPWYLSFAYLGDYVSIWALLVGGLCSTALVALVELCFIGGLFHCPGS